MKKILNFLFFLIFSLTNSHGKANGSGILVQPVCLDRFLLNLPSPVEVSAADASYKTAYGFAGMEFGAHGPVYAGNRIVETVPAGRQEYIDIYRGARKNLISTKGYNESIVRVKEKYERWIAEIKTGGASRSDELKEMQEIFHKKKSGLEFARNVSGEIKYPNETSFAIRRENEFTIGYLDSIDNRIRTVEGVFSEDAVQSSAAAAQEFSKFKEIYKRRNPSEIPSTAGFCTNYGFISEKEKPENLVTTETLFRSQKYPNLIFKIFIEPAYKRVKQNIQDLPNMDAGNAKLDLKGIKKVHGPTPVQILGAPGRIVSQEYGDNCSRESCRPPDQIYDFEAETFGESGRPDRPHVVLHMMAVTSDDYRLKLPAMQGDPTYNKPTKPGLSGKVPPPFTAGKEIFEQVLQSLRLRPGAIAGSDSK